MAKWPKKCCSAQGQSIQTPAWGTPVLVNFRPVSPSAFVLTSLLASLFLLLGLLAMPINAQTNSTWNGGTGNWSDTSNWNPGAVPNNGAGTAYSVTIDVPNSVATIDILNVTIDNLTLGAANSLYINPSNSLTLASGTSSNAGRQPRQSKYRGELDIQQHRSHPHLWWQHRECGS
jgi:hypothetical protein